MLLFRAEGENPVLPGTGPAVTTKSDDDDDQLDDDHDEQCKYNDNIDHDRGLTIIPLHHHDLTDRFIFQMTQFPHPGARTDRAEVRFCRGGLPRSAAGSPPPSTSRPTSSPGSSS